MRESDIVELAKKFIKNSDDASFLRFKEKFLSITTDMLCKKTDVPEGMTSREIGRKCVVMNLSDLAAVGSEPLGFLCAMSFPKDFDFKKVKEIFKGILKTLKVYETDFYGGDTNEGELVLSGVAFGISQRVILRSGAKPKDLICLTGDVGRVFAGFKDLRRATSKLKEKIYSPLARVEEGQKMCANSCIDISDGLSTELNHISKASKVRLNVESEKLPIHRDVFKVAERFSEDPISYALKSGEEFELLFTASKEMLSKNDFEFKVIGKVLRGRGVFVDGVRIGRMGWEHLV
ncbi:MAG: thiamine-phosphate kinase [Candidatus Methanofastidiosia archaeon]